LWEQPLAGLSPAHAAFARLVRLAGWLGLKIRRQDTPYEFAQRVTDAMPEADVHVTAITSAYVEERFARTPRAGEDGRLAEAWRAIRSAMARFAGRQAARKVIRRTG
jgi:hypothetical protein